MALGPVNEPVLLSSWGDHQRVFGGLAGDSAASYQISAFFNNGGGQAIGVRLFEPAFSDGEIASAVEAVGNAVATAADDLLSKTPTSSKTSFITSVSTLFTKPGQYSGPSAVAAGMLNTAWMSKSQTLSDPPKKVDVDDIFIDLKTGRYGFTATVSVGPIFAIAAATEDLLGTLQLEAAAGAGLEQINLVSSRLARTYSAQPLASRSLGVLHGAIIAAPTPIAVPATAAVALPAAYRQAVPALGGSTSDPVYGSAATAMNGALSDMETLGGKLGTVLTAQVALQAMGTSPGVGVAPAAVPKAADIVAAVQAFVASNFEGDAGAASVLALVKPITDGDPKTLADARDAVEKEVAGLLGTTPSKTATAAITAYANAPAGDLMVAIALAEVEAAVAALPSGAYLPLVAKSPGLWGNRLSVAVDANGISPIIATSLGVASPSDLFNLTVTYEDPSGLTQTETYRNVTLNPNYPSLSLANALATQSNYVMLSPDAAMAAGSVLFPGSGGQGAGGQDSLPLSMTTYLGSQSGKTGLYALEHTPIFNILCIPPDIDDGDTPNLVYQSAAQYCTTRNAMLIVDPPRSWQSAYEAGAMATISLADLGSFGADEGRSAAVYFPRVLAADPLRNGQVRPFPNSGYMAGLWAQTDVQTGIWKAPAGLTAALNGVAGLEAVLSDVQNGVLNPIGINCLRTFPLAGSVVWGARTMRGADQLGDQYNYIPVRRMLLYLMDWTLQNTKWAVFQANDEALWSGLRLQISSLLNGLWKQGALFGTSSDQAYFVKCDASTTLQADIDAGRVNIQIGFAPVKPAEFVVVTLQQIAGLS